MKRVVSVEEAKAKLGELLEAAASGETIEVDAGCGSVTLVATAEFVDMAMKAEWYEEQESQMRARLEEARTMTFEVDPEEEAEFQEAVEWVKEYRSARPIQRSA